MVHKLRSPLLNSAGSGKGVGLICVGSARVVVLHEHRSVSIEALSLAQSDGLAGLTLQSEAVLSCEIAPEIDHIEMVAAAVGAVYRHCRPLFHHAQRFVGAGFQLAEARCLATGKGRCVNQLDRWPLADVEVCVTNAAYGQTGIVVFASPPVAPKRGRGSGVPVAVGYDYVTRAVGVVNVQFGLDGLGAAVAYLALRVASGEHINVENAASQTRNDGICALAQQRCHVVGGVEHGLFIFGFARFEHVLRYWTAVQRHRKHAKP